MLTLKRKEGGLWFRFPNFVLHSFVERLSTMFLVRAPARPLFLSPYSLRLRISPISLCVGQIHTFQGATEEGGRKDGREEVKRPLDLSSPLQRLPPERRTCLLRSSTTRNKHDQGALRLEL